MVVRLAAGDIEPLLGGLAILGTGGGGNPDWGRQILENDVRCGRAWHVIDLDELDDDALVVCAGMMGSVKAIEAIGFAALLERWEDDFPLLTVVRAMEGLLGRRIDAVIPFEAGGLNSPVVLTLAARMGIAAVDADALGRSAPETHMTSWHGHGVAITPMPLADSDGNIVIVSQAATPTYVDEIGRLVISRGGHLGANCHHPMSGREARGYSVPGTFSAAAALGRAVADAVDPVAAAMAGLGASHLFRGRVVGLSEEEHPGFYVTSVSLSGEGADKGREARLIVKNETMALFVDGSLRVMFPDRVLMLEPATGRGLMSVELTDGLDVVVLGAPAHPRLRAAATGSPQGRAAFSAARYGQLDLEYRPIEELDPTTHPR
jgi:DUF917 family protein